MSTLATDLRYALAPACWAESVSPFILDPWQRSILNSSSKRILMLCSRQSGKSQTAAFLALHTALYCPPALVLLLSRALRQSQELFRKVLDAYRTIGETVAPEAESALRLELVNGSRIISLPGTEETVRSYSGVRLLVIDEASRVPDALFYATRPMLAVSGGKLVCLSTPFGQRGFFYEAWMKGEGWERIMIIATECPRISPEFLAEEKRTLGSFWYRQEYECQFLSIEDALLDPEAVDRAFSTEVEPLHLFGASLTPNGVHHE